MGVVCCCGREDAARQQLASGPFGSPFPTPLGEVSEKDKHELKEAILAWHTEDSKEAAEHRRDVIVQFFSEVPLFKTLPLEQRQKIATCSEPAKFSAGDVMIQQGDPGDSFFMITSGEARVTVNPGAVGKRKPNVSDDGGASQSKTQTKVLYVATLTVGDYFGETALLHESTTRTATVTAKSDLTALLLTRKQFREVSQRTLKLPKRNEVGGGKDTHIIAKEPSPKTPDERKLMGEALRGNANLKDIVEWTDDLVNQVIDVAWKEEITKGTELIRIADTVADHFYIVQSGVFEILIPEAKKDPNASQASPNKMYRFGTQSSGQSFGELALMYNHSRAATVRALEDSVVWVIDRVSFRALLVKEVDRTADHLKVLERIPVLEQLSRKEKTAIAHALVQVSAVKDQVLVEQGQPGDRMYVLYKGSVGVSKDGAHLGSLNAGSTFDEAHIIGERALVTAEPRAATVTVTSQEASLLSLDKQAVDLILGSIQGESKQNAVRATKFPKSANSNQAGSPESLGEVGPYNPMKIGFEDLHSRGLLGCGAFGVVDLVEYTNEQFYALKQLNKGWIVKQGMQKRTHIEKHILRMINCPFIIKLYATYNEPQTLHLLLELAQGGELFRLYVQHALVGSKTHAKHYSASVALAFEHMHERNILYRDLKPENLLLDAAGNLKVTDMGLAKFTLGKTYTTCGTPEYFAPEVVAGTGHTTAADWWTLGVLIYELMMGFSPFVANDVGDVFRKITAGIERVRWKDFKGHNCKDLIVSMMHEDPVRRLPCQLGGLAKVKEHKWYQGFDWDALAKLQLEPPHKPPKVAKCDTSNFVTAELERPPQIEYVDDGSGWDAGF